MNTPLQQERVGGREGGIEQSLLTFVFRQLPEYLPHNLPHSTLEGFEVFL